MKFPVNTDLWLMEQAPQNEVVISSRARIARNLPKVPFAPRANADQLRFIADKIAQAIAGCEELKCFQPYEMADLSIQERVFLRESHLISAELEKGGTGRMVFLSPEMDASIMVNEEDHLRISTLVSGYRVPEAYQRLRKIEASLERELDLAYSEEFGYLTACPTNTGTGLRLSVMLHLPALALTGHIEDTLSTLNHFGLIVRGAYGEHSENSGDLFQVSNEVTLGRSEFDILQTLDRIVRQIIEREGDARKALDREAREKLEDVVCRALGLLATARRMDSSEAVTLLSRARLGVGREWGMPLSHNELSRLFVDVQPAHLQFRRDVEGSPEQRDMARAALLRDMFTGKDRNN